MDHVWSLRFKIGVKTFSEYPPPKLITKSENIDSEENSFPYLHRKTTFPSAVFTFILSVCLFRRVL